MKYQAQTLEAPKAVATKGKPRKRGNSDALWGFTFLLPQLIGLLLFSIIPLISVFYLSMASWNGLGPITFVGLQNFIDQFQSSDLHIALLNTLAYTAIAVPGGLFLALLIALGLNNVRGKTVYRVLYFMPFITGSVAVGVIWAFLLNSDFGLFNSILRSVFHAKGVGWLTDPRFDRAGRYLAGIGLQYDHFTGGPSGDSGLVFRGGTHGWREQVSALLERHVAHAVAHHLLLYGHLHSQFVSGLRHHLHPHWWWSWKRQLHDGVSHLSPGL